MKSKKDIASEISQLSDIIDETNLIMVIARYAESGHATTAMIEQAIILADKHLNYARKTGDRSFQEPAERVKDRLQRALIEGVKSLKVRRGPGPEILRVEEPLARARAELGHQVRRQHKCAGGIIDIYDLTTDELIECKVTGDSASLGEAAGQLQRYRKSFPGASLTIAVMFIEDEARWLADLFRSQGIAIIEMGDRRK